MTFEEFEKINKSNIILVDVRENVSYLLGTIHGAENIPLDQLENEYQSLPKDKPIYVFCRSGIGSKEAVAFLKQKGYEVYNLDGGYETYLKYLMEKE